MVEKYNLKNELLKADEEMKGSLALMGMSALTVPTYNNSMRTVMFCSHLKQFVNLIHPDFPGFFTNAENAVGKHSYAYQTAKRNFKLVKRVDKYKKIVDHPFISTLFVYDEENDYYDIIEMSDYENLTEVFGYLYNNDYLNNLEVGDVVKKGDVYRTSSSYDEYFNYGYGKNITTMYTLEPYTSEDACIISESLSKMMDSIETNTVTISVNQNDYLLNLYGDKKTYKPFPDIGEFSHGELAARRTLFSNQLLSDFKDSALKEIQDSDVVFYKYGQVVDITILSNNPDLEDTPFTRQILKYLDAQNEYYRKIVKFCEKVEKSGSKYSANLDYAYKRAKMFLDDEAKWKEETVFSNLLIKVDIKEVVPIYVGQKMTGRHGNKSVVAVIRPDEEMPFFYDDNGNKVVVDMLLNALALINRTTAGPSYESTTNYCAKKASAHLATLETLEEKEEFLFDFINEFNEQQAADMHETYRNLTEEEKYAYMEDCIHDRIYISQPPMWETEPIFYRLVRVFEKYDFLTPYDIYINKWGRTIKCLNPAYVGEMYFLKLKQSSRKGFSVRNTGSINSKGLPERSYKNKSFTERISTTPIRFGEFETLNFALAVIPEDIQLFHLMYRSSAKARRDLAEMLLKDRDSFEISDSYTSRVGEIFNVIMKSLGLQIDFIDEDENYIDVYDDAYVKEWTYKGRSYFCTEYQFMLAKRRRDIEDDIIADVGIIQMDELNDKIMETLHRNTYVIGPIGNEIDEVPGYTPDTAF